MLTYNRAHFVREAVLSVISQTYANWELIIIDDGSKDDTKSVIENLGDKRIRYIKHEDNLGLHARRRQSLSYVTGEYTAVLDSDDYWTSPTKLASQVDFLEENKDHVVVGTMTKLIDAAGKDLGTCNFAASDTEIRKRILIRNQFTHSSILIRTEALKRTGGYQPTLAEDLELILQLGNLGQMANLNSYATAHRVHSDSENDHGLKMVGAVHQIIFNYRNFYPNYPLARAKSYLRLIWFKIQNFFAK